MLLKLSAFWRSLNVLRSQTVPDVLFQYFAAVIATAEL